MLWLSAKFHWNPFISLRVVWLRSRGIDKNISHKSKDENATTAVARGELNKSCIDLSRWKFAKRCMIYVCLMYACACLTTPVDQSVCVCVCVCVCQAEDLNRETVGCFVLLPRLHQYCPLEFEANGLWEVTSQCPEKKINCFPSCVLPLVCPRLKYLPACASNRLLRGVSHCVRRLPFAGEN